MAETAYPDSSFLVSMYRADGRQPAAHSFIATYNPSFIFLPLHRVELRNALRSAETQRLISLQDLRLAFKLIEEDLKDGLLIHTSISWNDICRRADELSEKYMASHGQRTIDLLHVAAALESRVPLFLSFDKRQRGLAQAAGLTVKP